MSPISQAELRTHYARTAIARMGIEFERGMAIASVRIAVDGAVVAARRMEAKVGRVASA